MPENATDKGAAPQAQEPAARSQQAAGAGTQTLYQLTRTPAPAAG